MFEVIKIENYEITRDVTVKNKKTGTVDLCFDDSAVVNENDFQFMKTGEDYDCKIKLIGKIVTGINNETVVCKIIDKCALVGNKEMIKVSINKDEYYMTKKNINGIDDISQIYFNCTRKDLIQVDDVIHGDYL